MKPLESELFAIRTFPRGSRKKPLSVFVGKRAAKTAVARNATKRRILAALRAVRATPTADILLSAKPQAASAAYREIEAEARRLFAGR